jgi:hypothetical protein
MHVTITQATVDALKRLGHVPDSLTQRFDAIAPGDGGFVLTLSEDDAMALAELVQWHIKTDPATGQLTPESRPYQDLVEKIDEAQFG